jgi:hypothetical protein
LWRRSFNSRDRVARLVGGAIITGIALSGGLRTMPGKAFVTTLGAAALFEGIMNRHITEYFNMNKLM